MEFRFGQEHWSPSREQLVLAGVLDKYLFSQILS